MVRPLLVLVSHGLDLATFMAIVAGGVHISGEYNPAMVVAYSVGGFALVVALKAAGAVALAFLVSRPRWPVTAIARYGLVPAVGMGLLGALVNSIAYAYI